MQRESGELTLGVGLLSHPFLEPDGSIGHRNVLHLICQLRRDMKLRQQTSDVEEPRSS